MPKTVESVGTLRPPFRAEGAKGWLVRLTSDLHELTDGNGDSYCSPLRLREDGREIGTPHAAHEKIRRDGSGHYSFWGDSLYFSTSDGSDPNTNGRLYDVILASPDRNRPSLPTRESSLFGRPKRFVQPGSIAIRLQ